MRVYCRPFLLNFLRFRKWMQVMRINWICLSLVLILVPLRIWIKSVMLLVLLLMLSLSRLVIWLKSLMLSSLKSLMYLLLLMRSNFFILVLLGIAFVLSLIVPIDVGIYCLSIAPVVGAALVAGGASIFNGLSGSQAQEKANSANAQIALENRAWQSVENQKNRDWEEYMWNQQNLYNTPSAMMQRYKEAGLNPYLVGNDSGIGQAGSAGSPSMVGAPNLPDIKPVNPWSSLGDAASKAISAYYQSKTVDSNVANQQSQAMKNYADAYSQLANTGMNHETIKSVLKPFTGSFEGATGSDSIQRTLAANASQAELGVKRQQMENEVYQLYGKEKAFEVIKNLRSATSRNNAEIERLAMQNKVSEQDIRESASRIAANFAQAFNLQKQGEYYVVSAKQLGIINQSLGLDLKEKEADFAFNTDVRKWKKDITHRDQALKLFTGSLDSQSMDQTINSNKFLRYGNAAASMVGQFFHVNVGFNSSSATFRDLTPKNKPMFYSGDGYRMQGGVLMKDNW